MTVDEAAVLLPLIYRLGQEIEDHRWVEALATWNQLLKLWSPLAQWNDEHQLLQHKVTLLELAERQASTHMH